MIPFDVEGFPRQAHNPTPHETQSRILLKPSLGEARSVRQLLLLRLRVSRQTLTYLRPLRPLRLKAFGSPWLREAYPHTSPVHCRTALPRDAGGRVQLKGRLRPGQLLP